VYESAPEGSEPLIVGPAVPEQTGVVLAVIVLLDTVHCEKSGDPIQKNKKSTEPNFIIL
jgi:hypothetical protein